MAAEDRSSVADGVGKLVIGGAVGFGLYFLATRLGFGRGAGGSAGGPTVPGTVTPTRARDAKRLNFVLTARGFEQRDESWHPLPALKFYALPEVIDRVKAGGRSDVALKISGAAIQRDVFAALGTLKQAGIDVWLVDAPTQPASVSGSRGTYGRMREARP